MRALALCLGTALLFGSVSCGGPTNAVFRISGNDQMKFSKESFKVRGPAVVRIEFRNEGKLPIETMGHNFVLLKRGTKPLEFGARCLKEGGSLENGHVPEAVKDQVIAHTELLGPGKSDVITVELSESGGLPVRVLVPRPRGHHERRAHGSLTVTQR